MMLTISGFMRHIIKRVNPMNDMCDTTITIKGLFAVALLSNGLVEDLDDPKLASSWEQFETDCMMMGYMIKKDEVEE